MFGVCYGMLNVKPFCHNKSSQIVVRFCSANTTLAMFGVGYGMRFVRPLCYNKSPQMIVRLYAANTTLTMLE